MTSFWVLFSWLVAGSEIVTNSVGRPSRFRSLLRVDQPLRFQSISCAFAIAAAVTVQSSLLQHQTIRWKGDKMRKQGGERNGSNSGNTPISRNNNNNNNKGITKTDEHDSSGDIQRSVVIMDISSNQANQTTENKNADSEDITATRSSNNNNNYTSASRTLQGPQNLMQYLHGYSNSLYSSNPSLESSSNSLPIGSDASSYKEALFAPGDIPFAWRMLVRETPLAAFHGRWEAILSRSDSMESILDALGVVPFKRRIMEKHHGITEVTVMDGTNSVIMQNYLPANLVVGARIPLNGEVFWNEEKETGAWLSRAFYVDGRLGQSRTSPKGTMYDVRAVFSSDPEGFYTGTGPLMLFRWTFFPAFSGSSNAYVVDRWLRRVG